MSGQSEIQPLRFLPSPVPYDPSPEMRDLMAKCPVSKVALPDGYPVWVSTGFQETREVMIDQRYSRELVFAPGGKVFGVDVAAEGGILAMDPPDHTRLRKLVSGAFTERRIAGLRPQVTEIVDDLIDGMLAGPRPADLAGSFSRVLPSRVMCLLLGVPAEDTAQFRGWSDQFFGAWSRPQEEVLQAFAALGAYMADLIARKRTEPADDLISVLVDARDTGGKLSETELVNFCIALLAAGYETTANMISLSFALLCQNPAELARLRADHGLIPQAVEELLRYVILSGTGNIGLPRVTREEVSLGGITIPAGEIIIPAFNYANRDPAVFEDPDRLDVTRDPRTHLAFGAGAHFCLGAQLARLELQEAFRGLLARLPGLRMTVPLPELEFREDQAITSVLELPVTWDDA
ncbi:MAG: cytochrome P450 [Streptosporangiales bacterium]|nr:cytochrome P450 [Streptosporangiales bacterium]